MLTILAASIMGSFSKKIVLFFEDDSELIYSHIGRYCLKSKICKKMVWQSPVSAVPFGSAIWEGGPHMDVFLCMNQIPCKMSIYWIATNVSEANS